MQVGLRPLANMSEESQNTPVEYHKIETSAGSSATPSRPGSPGAALKRGRVRFNSTSEANDAGNQRSSAPLRDKDGPSKRSYVTPPKPILTSPLHSRSSSTSKLLGNSPDSDKGVGFTEDVLKSPVLKPRPGVLRAPSYTNDFDTQEPQHQQSLSALAAQGRAQRIASLVGSNSAPATTRTSLDSDVDLEESYSPTNGERASGFLTNIPLGDLDSRRTYDQPLEDSDEDRLNQGKREIKRTASTREAHDIVRAHTRKHRAGLATKSMNVPSTLASGQVTPIEEKSLEEYQPRPQQFRGGVLSELLKLYKSDVGNDSGNGSRPASRRSSLDSMGSTVVSAGSSGATTPKTKHTKWYKQKNQSQDTLAGLIEASAKLAGASASPTAAITNHKKKLCRPGMGNRSHSGKLVDAAMSKFRPRLEDEIRITIHIAETLSRQKYVVMLCRALIMYGAPTHRLEEYLKATSRILEIDSNFLYIPGCMIISFDDATTHTTEVKLIKSAQGVDLGKLKDVHEIYKEVVHDLIGVEEATKRLGGIVKADKKYNPWLLVIVYGLASACVGPFGMCI